MHLAMAPEEALMLGGMLRGTARYLEFGAGGSTVLAAHLVQGSITTVDSSTEWLDRVAAACPATSRARLTLHHADIGPVGEWGVPLDPALAPCWPCYHEDVWTRQEAAAPELVLVDGRFRIACAIQALLRTAPGTPVLLHDYPERPHYHVLERLAKPVVATRSLVAFTRRVDFDAALAQAMLAAHAQDLN